MVVVNQGVGEAVTAIKSDAAETAAQSITRLSANSSSSSSSRSSKSWTPQPITPHPQWTALSADPSGVSPAWPDE